MTLTITHFLTMIILTCHHQALTRRPHVQHHHYLIVLLPGLRKKKMFLSNRSPMNQTLMILMTLRTFLKKIQVMMVINRRMLLYLDSYQPLILATSKQFLLSLLWMKMPLLLTRKRAWTLF